MENSANHTNPIQRINDMKRLEERTCYRCAHSGFENQMLKCPYGNAIRPCHSFKRVDWRDSVMGGFETDKRLLWVLSEIHRQREKR